MSSTEQLNPFEAAGDLPPGLVPDVDVGARFEHDPIGAEPAYQPGTIAHLESFDCGPRLSAYGPDEDLAAYRV